MVEGIDTHDGVIKWKHFPRNWPFVQGIHRSPVNSPHKGQWRGALVFSLICARINDWVNNGEAGDLRRNRVHYDVIVMRVWGHGWYPTDSQMSPQPRHSMLPPNQLWIMRRCQAKLPLSCQSLKSRAIENIGSHDLIVLQDLATIMMSQHGLCH